VATGSCLAILLAMSIAFGADSSAPANQQLIAIDAQLKTLMAGRMSSPAVQEAMMKLRAIDRTREATLAEIPEVKQLDAEMKQMTDKLREMQRTRAARVQKAKGPELADLDRQTAEAQAIVSGMSDPTIRALVQQRMQLMYAVQSSVKKP
jgi:hypothetical protein